MIQCFKDSIFFPSTIDICHAKMYLEKKIDISGHEIVRCSNAKGIIKIPTQIVVRALRRSNLIDRNNNNNNNDNSNKNSNWFLAGSGLTEVRTTTLCRIVSTTCDFHPEQPLHPT